MGKVSKESQGEKKIYAQMQNIVLFTGEAFTDIFAFFRLTVSYFESKHLCGHAPNGFFVALPILSRFFPEDVDR